MLPGRVRFWRKIDNPALEGAFARAEQSKIEMLKRPDMVNGEDLATQLGLSRTTVDNRRVAGQLLALEFGSRRGFRFPLWQRELVLDGRVRTTFEGALSRLASVAPWSRYRFFTQGVPALGGKSPVQALLAGEGDRVLHAAESWAAAEQGGG